jgi:endonuclease/exonuclease/phosphatase (EEP) superfamily protein YafD
MTLVSRYFASLHVRFLDMARQRPGRFLAFATIIFADIALLFVILGRFWPAPDMFSPLAIHSFMIAVVAAVALLMKRQEIALISVGTVAVLAAHAWLGLSGDKSFNAAERVPGVENVRPVSADGTLRIISINTWHKLRDSTALHDYLMRERADVVVMTEMGPDKLRLLDELKAAYPHQVHCAESWVCSMALISRYPISDAGAARVAIEQPPLVWARVKAMDAQVMVVGTHLHRPSRSPWLHEKQMTSLIQFISLINGPTVLAGDFNTAPWANSFKRLMLDAWMFPALQLKPTWPAWPVALPQVALDHVLVSADLTIARSGTGPAVGSDHLPVWAEIKLPVPRIPAQPGRSLQRASLDAAPLSLAAAFHLGGELAADLGGEHAAARYLSR